MHDDDWGSVLEPQGKRINAESVCVQRHTVRVASLMIGYAVEGQLNAAGRPPDANEILRTTPGCITCSAPVNITAVGLKTLQLTQDADIASRVFSACTGLWSLGNASEAYRCAVKYTPADSRPLAGYADAYCSLLNMLNMLHQCKPENNIRLAKTLA